MNILMMTNTYLPFVGGVERSVEAFTKVYRKMGHRVLVVAPRFEDMPKDEKDVVRVPALQHFNGTDFSVQLPIPGILSHTLKAFQPDIVHSHHPYMIGDSALRIAVEFKIPIVFTFHTFYERYTHYVPGDSPALKRFVISLATGYANLCNTVFAPSHYVANELVKRGVTVPIEVVPTGISVKGFATGSGKEFRRKYNIPAKAFVVGFVSRLAPEKNVTFLSNALKRFLITNKQAHFIIIGCGPSKKQIEGIFSDGSIRERVHFTGTLSGQDLIDGYHAMDTFAFASQTETQGLVLVEALASGIPVVAVDGPGVGEVVKNQVNGRIIPSETIELFSDALQWVSSLTREQLGELKRQSRMSAENYSEEQCAQRALGIYDRLLSMEITVKEHKDNSSWAKAKRLIKAELELLKNMTRATGAAMNE